MGRNSRDLSKNRKRKGNELQSLKKKMRKMAEQIKNLESGSEDSDSSRDSRKSHSSTSSSESGPSVLNESLITILGANPTDEKAFGPEISQEVAKRWESYLSLGIDKETKTHLLEKWCVPANCKNLQAPQLNPEVQAMLSTTEQKKETFLMELQAILGKGLTALASTLDKLIQEESQKEEREESNTKLTNLVEAGKLLCQVHFTISNHRKFQLNQHFNIKVQKVAATQKTDSFLFGEDFAEKCKNIKSFEITAKQLKAGTSTSKNYQTSATKSRWKGKQKTYNYKPKYNKSYKEKEPRKEWTSYRREWKKT